MKTILRILLFQALNKNSSLVQLGRWKILENNNQLMKRIDLANEDNCACKDYILQMQNSQKLTFHTQKVDANYKTANGK